MAAGAGDRKGKSRALPGDANGDGGQDFLALDLDGDRGESGQMQPGGAGGGGYQQMQLVEQQVKSDLVPSHENELIDICRTTTSSRARRL